MVLISDLMDTRATARLIADGYIAVQRHPTENLWIYNYTKKAQYEKVWTPETVKCRGLIVAGNKEIVARPFEKFFNLEERTDPLPDEPYDVFEKLDGSLGILYQWPRIEQGIPQRAIATRGSFKSDQAIVATEILRRKYADAVLHPNLTYLFEIIFPSNRIVVDYGQMEDLVLLAVIDTETGRDLNHQTIGWPGPVAQARRVPKIGQLIDMERDGLPKQTSRVLPFSPKAVRSTIHDREEGVVVRFAGGLRVKLKGAEYVRLHRIVTGLNRKVIWEYLSEGKDLQKLMRDVPEEFATWIKWTAADLRAAFVGIEMTALREFQTAPTYDRKALAQWAQREATHPHLIYRLADGSKYQHLIWKMVKPKAAETVFWQAGEEETA